MIHEQDEKEAYKTKKKFEGNREYIYTFSIIADLILRCPTSYETAVININGVYTLYNLSFGIMLCSLFILFTSYNLSLLFPTRSTRIILIAHYLVNKKVTRIFEFKTYLELLIPLLII